MKIALSDEAREYLDKVTAEKDAKIAQLRKELSVISKAYNEQKERIKKAIMDEIIEEIIDGNT